MAKRHVYNKEELDLYFDRVCVPKSRRIYDVSSISDEDRLSFLNLLQKHHLVKVPWENLTQHYSWHTTINVKPKHLFKKIVSNPGTGGYCMEVNYFFHLILYSLGFVVYMSGSRIYHQHTGFYGGWTHVGTYTGRQMSDLFRVLATCNVTQPESSFFLCNTC